jgi:3-dehydroquinate dehydratase-1
MEFETFRLAASTADLSEEPAAREHADLIEYRMDLADDRVAPLRAYEGELPILVTNRVDWEGGEAADTSARLDVLAEAVGLPAVEAVDLELRAVTEDDAERVLEQARDAGVSTVVSTHDFSETPERERLRALLERACEYGDVGKLAVTANDRRDVLDLLSVTEQLTATGTRVATMAMGEAGRHSRAVAPLYGSVIGYAPVDPVDATAPGQYDLATLRDLVSTLQSQP